MSPLAAKRAMVARTRNAAVLIGSLAVACLVAVAMLSSDVGTVPTEMPVSSQFTTTTTQTCGCCGIVGCYCQCQADEQLANVPDMGTQAGVPLICSCIAAQLSRGANI